MNGVTADAMTDAGLQYKTNLGVGIPRLKEIAANFELSADLARRLWLLGGRETMILALILFPKEKISQNDFLIYEKGITNLELAEQAAMQLFSKLENSQEISKLLLNSTNSFAQVAGLLTISRIYNQLDNTFIDKILDFLPAENIHLYKAAATSLGRFCRISEVTANEIKIKLNSKSANFAHISLTYTTEIVEQELKFLNY